jgi:hypothetical protein
MPNLSTNISNNSQYFKHNSLLPNYQDFSKVVGFTPTWMSLCDEETGSVRDVVSNNHLTAVGTAVYKAYRGGYQGVGVTAATTGFRLDTNDFANTNSVMGGWFTVDDAVAAQRSILGRYATGRYALFSIQTSAAGGGLANKAVFQCHDGTVSPTITLDKVVTDGVRRLWLAQIDRTAQVMRFLIAAPGEATVSDSLSIATLGTLTGGVSPFFNLLYASGAQNGDDSWCGGAFVRINADMGGSTVLSSIASALVR